MLMKSYFFGSGCAVAAAIALSSPVEAAPDLSSAVIQTAPISVNDLVYDLKRDLLYGSVPGSAGAPYGNSLIAIAPDTLTIVDSFFVGSDPNLLAISRDGSRIYAGLDGSRAVIGYDLDAGTLLPSRPIRSYWGDPAVVENIAVSPTDPTIFITANDELGSTADGDLEIHGPSASTFVGFSEGTFDNNRFAFDDADTFITVNTSNTGFDLKRWSFDGTTLTFEQKIGNGGGNFGTDIEVGGGRITYTNGVVVDVGTLTSLGTFPGASGDVEPFPTLGATYFYNNGLLTAYDDATFLVADSINLGGPASRELLYAGDQRLAVLSSGSISVITGVPVPEPHTVGLLSLGMLAVIRQRRRLG